MTARDDRRFGAIINRLIQRENLTRQEAAQAFNVILSNATTPVQQGAFLAALTAKGETEMEVAGAWDAIYQLDTVKIELHTLRPVVENSGTGRDTFKTFNISTAAAIVAAARGVPMARHGSRAITSFCGTVDISEKLGIDVDCPPAVVAKSIEKAGIGLFNGMSPAIHPGALGRILSQVCFGSTLNIAASLANPALPAIGVRGVYSKEMILPVIGVMKSIGYKKALVIYGEVESEGQGANRLSAPGMDEASVNGPTYCARLFENGDIETFTIRPQNYGLGGSSPHDLSPGPDMDGEVRRFVDLISNRESSLRKEAVMINAALIFYAADIVAGIEAGLEMAADALESGAAFKTLTDWVSAQNRDPEKGMKTLERLVA